MSLGAAVLAETHEVHNELPAHPAAFGIAALVILFGLLWITTRFDPDR
jgi:hypothetical protein